MDNIDKLIKYNVCARCYGDLVKVYRDQKLQPVCTTCGDAWHGATIKKTTAIRKGMRAVEEFQEIKYTLPDLFPNPHKGRRAADLLKEMGF